MRIYLNSSVPIAQKYYHSSFKGGKDEIISTALKETVGDLLPTYKAIRAINKLGQGEGKAAIKQGIGMVDNVIMQPTKQAIASAVAAKCATVGSIFGPLGTAIGGGIGYFGTLLAWGKTRNSIVDSIMEDD